MPTPLSLNWSNEPSITTAGFTQNTGGINVGVSYVNDGSGNNFAQGSTAQYVGTGEPFSATSSLQLGGDGNDGTPGDNETSTTTIDFSAVSGSGFANEVTDVAFRINDFDTSTWLDVVTVRAFDANGNQLDVTFTHLGVTTTGTDNSLTSTSANGSAATETGSILVEIPGPVSYIEIDYNNDGTGGQALWVTDIHFDALTLDGTVEGTTGDDVIDGTYIADPDGDRVDAGDEILPGAGTDDDLIEAYGGNDSISAGAGNDEIYGGTGNDSIVTGDGNDTVYAGAGDDTVGDWSTDNGNDTILGEAGNDLLNGGNGDDVVLGGADNDTLIGASGDDSLYGGDGSDIFRITDDHDISTIFGGEDGDGSDNDSIEFYNWSSTDGVTIIASGDEAGNFDFNGTLATGSYAEIEELDGTDYDDTFNLALDNSGVSVEGNAGDDVITTGSGDDVIEAGSGADTMMGLATTRSRPLTPLPRTVTAHLQGSTHST